jgi:hypothetical protein
MAQAGATRATRGTMPEIINAALDLKNTKFDHWPNISLLLLIYL